MAQLHYAEGSWTQALVCIVRVCRGGLHLKEVAVERVDLVRPARGEVDQLACTLPHLVDGSTAGGCGASPHQHQVTQHQISNTKSECNTKSDAVAGGTRTFQPPQLLSTQQQVEHSLHMCVCFAVVPAPVNIGVKRLKLRLSGSARKSQNIFPAAGTLVAAASWRL